jgi:hypothetical protein
MQLVLRGPRRLRSSGGSRSAADARGGLTVEHCSIRIGFARDGDYADQRCRFSATVDLDGAFDRREHVVRIDRRRHSRLPNCSNEVVSEHSEAESAGMERGDQPRQATVER